MNDLPEFFILYNPKRSSADIYGGLAYVSSATSEIGIVTLTVLPYSQTPFLISKKPTEPQGINTKYGCVTISKPNGDAVKKTLYNWTSWFHIKSGQDMPDIPVLEIRSKVSEHFSGLVKRNINFTYIPGSPEIQSTPSPKKVIKLIKHTVLSHHVAVSLLEYAMSKNETCPITAEKLSKNTTAIMPCGHLFMISAIEESFKIRNGVCPLCRDPGMPAYV